MKVALYSKEGKKKKDIELNDDFFAARVNERLLALVRNAYAANLRKGTACTKTRSDMRGGGKKPWKQKGTGRARASSIRSPLWRGGGTVFGPKPRSYYVDLPSSMRRSALISALSKKVKDSNLFLTEDLKLAGHKTKDFFSVLRALPTNDRKVLYIVSQIDENLSRATANLKDKFEVRVASEVNAYHILQREKLMISEEAVSVIEKRLLPKQKKVVEVSE
jgi:large subunit ribosomal protein L4